MQNSLKSIQKTNHATQRVRDVAAEAVDHRLLVSGEVSFDEDHLQHGETPANEWHVLQIVLHEAFGLLWRERSGNGVGLVSIDTSMMTLHPGRSDNHSVILRMRFLTVEEKIPMWDISCPF